MSSIAVKIVQVGHDSSPSAAAELLCASTLTFSFLRLRLLGVDFEKNCVSGSLEVEAESMPPPVPTRLAYGALVSLTLRGGPILVLC